jgi:hypothetical protein
MPNLPLGAYSDGSSADAMCRASAILGTSKVGARFANLTARYRGASERGPIGGHRARLLVIAEYKRLPCRNNSLQPRKSQDENAGNV